MDIKEKLKKATNYQYPNVLEMNHRGRRYLFGTSGSHAVGIVSDEPIDVMDTNNIGNMLAKVLNDFAGTEVVVSLTALRDWVGTKKPCEKCNGTGEGECWTCSGTCYAPCECSDCGDSHESECPDCDDGTGSCVCVSKPELGKIGKATFQLEFIRQVLDCLPDGEVRLSLGKNAIEPVQLLGDDFFAIVMPYGHHSFENLPEFNVPVG